MQYTFAEMAKDKLLRHVVLVIGVVIYVASSQCQINATGGVRAIPMHSASPAQRYPRVAGLPDAEAQQQANVVLLARERLDAERRRNCLSFRQTNEHGIYTEKIRVTYLTKRFLSIDVRETDFGCAAYPNIDIPFPLTIDLQTGHAVDWETFFTTDFMIPKGEEPSHLTRLYLDHYKNDAECTDIVKKNRYGFDIWLDSASSSLIVAPNLPHVIRACVDVTAIPLSDVIAFVVDKSAALQLQP